MFLTACVAVACSFCIVLSAIISPIILVLVGGFLKLALMLGIGDALARDGIAAIHDFAVRSASVLNIPIGHYDVVAGASLSTVLLELAVPPLLTGALVWWSLRGLFLRASGADLIRHFCAQPMRADVAEERQFIELVEEVAAGASAPAPKPYVIDSPTINATALGRMPDNAVLLVTRGLLDQLDRDETKAIIARLVTRLAVGDMQVARGVMATFHTFFLFLTVLDLPFRLSAWRTLSRLALLIATPRPRIEDITRVSAALEDSAQIDSIGFLKVPMFFWSQFILSPPMRSLWRSRCFWSDAQTVKLTHTPHAFARALQKIGETEPLPRAAAYAWLFVGTPAAPSRGSFSDYQRMIVVLPPTFAERVNRLNALEAASRRTQAAAKPGKTVVSGVELGVVTLLWGAALFLSAATAMALGLAVGLPLVILLI